MEMKNLTLMFATTAPGTDAHQDTMQGGERQTKIKILQALILAS
jgi:hypothetical protein